MKKTKIYLDCEMTGLHQNTTLISIGFISECGKTFYAELTDYDKSQIDGWLQENVIDNLLMEEPKEGESNYYSATRNNDNPLGNDLYNSYSIQIRCDKIELKEELTKWLSQFGEVEIWSDVLAYDWVLFCQIFSHAFKIPNNVYYIPRDLSTLLLAKGFDSDINREEFSGYKGKVEKHNALYDAKIIKSCVEKLLKQ